MNLKKNKVEELISTAKKITEAQKNNKNELLFNITKDNEDRFNELNSLLDDDVLQDPEKSYNLFYQGIQAFLLQTLPQGEMRTIILELKSVLLTGKEKANVKSGKRGADSRMAHTKKMEVVIDTLTDWSETPEDYFRLANLLLDKNKELGFSPNEREISDFI